MSGFGPSHTGIACVLSASNAICRSFLWKSVRTMGEGAPCQSHESLLEVHVSPISALGRRIIRPWAMPGGSGAGAALAQLRDASSGAGFSSVHPSIAWSRRTRPGTVATRKQMWVWTVLPTAPRADLHCGEEQLPLSSQQLLWLSKVSPAQETLRCPGHPAHVDAVESSCSPSSTVVLVQGSDSWPPAQRRRIASTCLAPCAHESFVSRCKDLVQDADTEQGFRHGQRSAGPRTAGSRTRKIAWLQLPAGCRCAPVELPQPLKLAGAEAGMMSPAGLLQPRAGCALNHRHR